jgi:hypothetical protein
VDKFLYDEFQKRVPKNGPPKLDGRTVYLVNKQEAAERICAKELRKLCEDRKFSKAVDRVEPGEGGGGGGMFHRDFNSRGIVGEREYGKWHRLMKAAKGEEVLELKARARVVAVGPLDGAIPAGTVRVVQGYGEDNIGVFASDNKDDPDWQVYEEMKVSASSRRLLQIIFAIALNHPDCPGRDQSVYRSHPNHPRAPFQFHQHPSLPSSGDATSHRGPDTPSRPRRCAS